MAAQVPAETWAAGDAYEAYVGRWSRIVAREFVRWLDLPPDLAWLDIGCGTGALSEAIVAQARPGSVLAIDPSAGFLAYARQRIPDPRVSFRQGDALALPDPDHPVDAAVSGLVLNFVADHARAVAEMRRTLRPGGTAALYVWDYSGAMEMMRIFWNEAAALDPGAAALDEGRRFPICRPDPLINHFKGVGFSGVELRIIDVPTVFRTFDDYWTPFLGGQGPAPGYCARLAPDRREALRLRLHAALPVQPDGSIHLIARAFAVRGTVPGP